MRCLMCAAEMYVTQVVQDGTMPVPGFEHHTGSGYPLDLSGDAPMVHARSSVGTQRSSYEEQRE